MSNHSVNNKRIAKNTVMLYFRTLITMIISLYTSRVVLKALGVEDYGIYNAVGGFVAMFSVISSSLSVAISRYITFEIGKGNKKRLNKIFSTSILLQCLISLLVLILSLTVGVWAVNNKMTIPLERLYAANWVFILSVVTFVVNLISVPYNACIIAHEKMKAFAYIGILEATCKLLTAYCITVSPFDKLIIYSILMCILSLFIRFIYCRYCQKRFSECRSKLSFDKIIMKEIFGFTGWNFIGASSGVLNDYGVNFLINLFCGPIVNAARGIAMQVSFAISSFHSSFTTALNPQIIKSYASKDFEHMSSLAIKGSKFSGFLLLIMCIPIISEADIILHIWLGDVPEYSVWFVRLILINSIIMSQSGSITTIMLATGEIKYYQIFVGGVQLLGLPLSYLFLIYGFSPIYTAVAIIIVSCCTFCMRLIMIKRTVDFPIQQFLLSSPLRIIVVFILSYIFPFLLIEYYPTSNYRPLLNLFLTPIYTIIIIYIFGCTKGERHLVKSKIKNTLTKYIK